MIFFIGASGLYYPFQLYPLDAALPNKAAVYIYIKIGTSLYTPLYIGQTDALDKDIDNYQTWRCVSRNFGNALCVHFEKNLDTRCQIVRDLIDIQEPVCTDILPSLKTWGSFLDCIKVSC